MWEKRASVNSQILRILRYLTVSISEFHEGDQKGDRLHVISIEFECNLHTSLDAHVKLELVNRAVGATAMPVILVRIYPRL